MPFYNDEKDPSNLSHAERNQTHVTWVPQGQQHDALADYASRGCLYVATNNLHLVSFW